MGEGLACCVMFGGSVNFTGFALLILTPSLSLSPGHGGKNVIDWLSVGRPFHRNLWPHSPKLEGVRVDKTQTLGKNGWTVLCRDVNV